MRTFILALIFALLTSSAFAQRHGRVSDPENDPELDHKTCGACFRGKPKPDCCSFFLVEFGLGSRVVESNTRPNKDNLVFLADLGYMHNWRERSALGASVHLTVDDDGARWSIVPRYRRWLGPSTAADLKLGVIFAADDNYGKISKPGLISGASLSFAEWLSLDILWELYKYKWSEYVPDAGGTFVERSGTSSSVYISASGRSYGALIAGGAFVIVGAIALSSLDLDFGGSY